MREGGVGDSRCRCLGGGDSYGMVLLDLAWRKGERGGAFDGRGRTGVGKVGT